MTGDTAGDTAPALPTHRFARQFELARVLDLHDAGCRLQFLHDRRVAGARLSDAIRQRGIVVRPGDLVAVSETHPLGDAPAFEVFWRGPAVVRVTAVDGVRITYHTGGAPTHSVTKTLRDERPEGERQAVRPGQEIVVFPVPGDPEVASLVDVAVDGLPLHAGRVRDACVARAARVAGGSPAVGEGGAAGAAGERDPRRLVADGYDRIAERYARWTAGEVVDEARPRYLAHLLDRLPPGARVLELGCGGGGPTTQRLAARFVLTGVDISARQIELARANVPAAQLIRGDMTRLELAPESFDGVVSFYAFGHLPYGELPGLLRRINRWLRPDGLLVASMARFDPGTIEPDWLGAPMYFSGYAPEDTRRFLEQAGLRIELFREETITEDGQPTRFLWVVAQKVDAAASQERGDAP